MSNLNEDRILELCILVGMKTNDEDLIKKGYTSEEIEEAKERCNKAERLLWQHKLENPIRE